MYPCFRSVNHGPKKFERVSLGLSLALGLSSALAASPSAQVVISQVYGGGGNSGATWKRDFIELFNRGEAPVSLEGWSVHYASSAGSTWQRTALSGELAAGAHYLVWEGQGAGGTLDLPPADATGNIALSGTSGKVALTATSATLSGVCPSGLIDRVGYGSSANCFEGAGPTPTLSNATAALRGRGGCEDSDDNSLDFVSANPDPRNTSVTPAPCSSLPPPPPPAPPSTIAQIQGRSHRSPLENQDVNGVAGIVTAVKGNGFYLQDPVGDNDPETSEALFVFTASAPQVSLGDALLVAGKVTEFRAGGNSGLANLALTEITAPRITVAASGQALPAPILLGTGGRLPPADIIDNDAVNGTGDVEISGLFEPGMDGIDFYESLEGMRVRVPDPQVVGPTSSFGEFAIVGERGAQSGLMTRRGGIKLRSEDANPERIHVDDAFMPTPLVKVGDYFAGDIEGILEYSFGAFKLAATSIPSVLDGGLKPDTAQCCRSNHLTLASFNVENLDPNDPPEKFAALARLIVSNLGSPQILGLEEMQDGNGAIHDTLTSSQVTAQMLIAAIAAAGGPEYSYTDIAPQSNQDGGEPGGNIRQGFLWRQGQGLKLVARPGGDAVTPNAVESTRKGPRLRYSPGRLDPLNPAFTNSRKPLAVEFQWKGEPLFLIANHFNSKGGDQPLMGRFQPPQRPSETQRHAQATVVADFVVQILSLDKKAMVVVLGDINDFEFSETAAILENAGLHNLMQALPERDRYTYVFEGNSQSLDHILVSKSLHKASGPGPKFEVVHVNAEFPQAVSDHDPLRTCLEKP